jgi:predicted O-methyltransferase YrrM
MWFKTTSYLRFLWFSKNQHGIHSPFVYHLITRCFYNKAHFKTYQLWDKVQQYLLSSKEYLIYNVEAKPKFRKKQTVAQLAKDSSFSKKRARLMIRLADYLNVENALELGTGLGLTSISMAGSGKVKLKTVENNLVFSEFAQTQFEKLGLNSISCIHSNFEKFHSELQPKEKFDLVFIHVNQSGTTTLSYFESLLIHKHNDTLFVLEGIHSSSDMEKLWKQIQNHPQVQVTIDTFQWGLVFFRKEQVKQHFVIRV